MQISDFLATHHVYKHSTIQGLWYVYIKKYLAANRIDSMPDCLIWKMHIMIWKLFETS